MGLCKGAGRELYATRGEVSGVSAWMSVSRILIAHRARAAMIAEVCEGME